MAPIVKTYVPSIVYRPGSDVGSDVYLLAIEIFDTNWAAQAPDAAPTVRIVAENGSTQRLAPQTMTQYSALVGKYYYAWSVSNTWTLENEFIEFSYQVSSVTYKSINLVQVLVNVPDAVWDEDSPSHLDPNTFGAAIFEIIDDTSQIKPKTDNLPSDPTSETNATSNKNSIITEVDANEVKIDGIKAKTDILTFNGSNVLSEDQSPEIHFHPIFLGGFDYYDYKQAQQYPVYIVDAKGRVTLTPGNVTTPGSYLVVRYRQNQSAAVQSGALTVGTTNGLNVYFTFDPDTAPNDIKPGDSISLVFLDTVVTVGGQVFDMPTITLGPFTVVDSVSEPGEVQAGCTTTSIITDITGPGDDTYNNMQLQVISNFGGSDPIKLTRQIKDFVQSTGTFIVEPAFPAAPASGDVALVIANITEDLDAKDRMLGLLHQNIAVEHTFVGDNHTQSDYWIYDTKANANTHDKSTGLLFTYSLVTTFDINDKPSITKMVKDS
jgi:hypothetical protein